MSPTIRAPTTLALLTIRMVTTLDGFIILVRTVRLQSSKMSRTRTPRLTAFSGFDHMIQKAGPISDMTAVVIPAQDKTRDMAPLPCAIENPRLKLTMNATYNCANLVPAQICWSVSMKSGRI